MKIRIINKSIALALVTLTVGGNLNCIIYADGELEGNSSSDSPATTQSCAFMKHIRDRKDLLQKYKSYSVYSPVLEFRKNNEFKRKIEEFDGHWEGIETDVIKYAEEEKILKRMEKDLKPKASETEDGIKLKKKELDRKLKEIERSIQEQQDTEMHRGEDETRELYTRRKMHLDEAKSLIDFWHEKLQKIMVEWSQLRDWSILYNLKPEDLQKMHPIILDQYKEKCIDFMKMVPEKFRFELVQFRAQIRKLEDDLIAEYYLTPDIEEYLGFLKNLRVAVDETNAHIEKFYYPMGNKCLNAINLIHNVEYLENYLNALKYTF